MPRPGAGVQPASRVTPEPSRCPDRRRRWWVYVFGDLIGAAIAVMIITLVRGLSNDKELEAAEGAALPLMRRAGS